jgi:hypothetical protein
MDLFIERFVDAFAPDGGDGCGRSDAIRKAGSDRMFSPMLNEAFQAVSVAYFGQGVGSREALAHGYRSYGGVLNQLNSALVDPRQSRSAGVFATVILLMAYEVSSRLWSPKVQHSFPCPESSTYLRTRPHYPLHRCIEAHRVSESLEPHVWN